MKDDVAGIKPDIKFDGKDIVYELPISSTMCMLVVRCTPEGIISATIHSYRLEG